MKRWIIRCAVATVLLVVGLGPTGQPSAAALQPLVAGWERYFKIDWQAGAHQGRPTVYGHVYNDWGMAAANLRLLVEGVDERGAVVSQTVGWVGTLLTPGTTAPFEVRVDRGAPSYRVTVFAFDWVQRGRGIN